LTLTAFRADDAHAEQSSRPPPALRPLRRSDLSADAVTTAKRLLGTLLVRAEGEEVLVARIAETEAYGGPEDWASHARAGRTARTSTMFGPPGHAYVYLVYGLHHCLNVVCAADGEASAVLIRAVEPVEGIERMRARRGPAAGRDARLAAGPARTCQALDIDRRLDGIDLLHDERLWLADGTAGEIPATAIVSGPRIGVDYASPEWASRPWRFGIADSEALSKPFGPVR
jgi:DNA-3-methyladenine glycosylase